MAGLGEKSMEGKKTDNTIILVILMLNVRKCWLQAQILKGMEQKSTVLESDLYDCPAAQLLVI